MISPEVILDMYTCGSLSYSISLAKLILLAFFILLSSSDEEFAAFSLRFDLLSDRCLVGLLLRDGGAEMVDP